MKNLIPFFCLGMICLMNTAGAVGVLQLPDTITVGPGEEFDLPINVDTISGLLGYYFVLSHSSQVECLSASAGSLLSAWSDPTLNAQPGQCTLAAFSATAAYGSGGLAILHFRAKDNALNGHIGQFRFTTAEFNDGALPVTTDEGTLKIAQTVAMMLPDSLRRAPGDELSLPVQLDDAGGVLGFLFTLQYNPAHLEFLGYENGSSPEEWGEPTLHQHTNLVTLAGIGATPLSGPKTLAILNFKIRDDAPPDMFTSIILQNAELNDGAIVVVTQDTTINIYDPSALPLGGLALLTPALAALGILARRNKPQSTQSTQRTAG